MRTFETLMKFSGNEYNNEFVNDKKDGRKTSNNKQQNPYYTNRTICRSLGIVEKAMLIAVPRKKIKREISWLKQEKLYRQEYRIQGG